MRVEPVNHLVSVLKLALPLQPSVVLVTTTVTD